MMTITTATLVAAMDAKMSTYKIKVGYVIVTVKAPDIYAAIRKAKKDAGYWSAVVLEIT